MAERRAWKLGNQLLHFCNRRDNSSRTLLCVLPIMLYNWKLVMWKWWVYVSESSLGLLKVLHNFPNAIFFCARKLGEIERLHKTLSHPSPQYVAYTPTIILFSPPLQPWMLSLSLLLIGEFSGTRPLHHFQAILMACSASSILQLLTVRCLTH